MTRSFSALALAGAMFAAGAAFQPAAARSNATPDLRGTSFDRPAFTAYSWGVLHSPVDGPQVRFSWDQVNRQLESARSVGAAASRSAAPSGEPISDLRPYEQILGPSYLVYSWGVLKGSSDSRPTAYTWDELRRALAKREAAPIATRSGSLGVNQDAPEIRSLRGTKFDRPEFVRYSWGFLESPNDGPQVQHAWAEVNAYLAKMSGADVVRSRSQDDRPQS